MITRPKIIKFILKNNTKVFTTTITRDNNLVYINALVSSTLYALFKPFITTDKAFIDINNVTKSPKICFVFGGGGHSRAAGCTIKSNVETSVKKLLDEIRRNSNA